MLWLGKFHRITPNKGRTTDNYKFIINNKHKTFWERHKAYINKAVCDSFKQLKEFKQKVFGVKSLLFGKEKGIDIL